MNHTDMPSDKQKSNCIPAADLPYVFARYRRAGNATGISPGSDIGLASVRQIVE